MNILLLLLTIIAILIDIFLPLFIPTDDCIKKTIFNLLVNISYSYIIGYIFYLVAFIPQRSNNNKMKKVLNKKVKLVYSELDRFFSVIYDEAGIKDKTLENLQEACKKVNPKNNAKTITLGYETKNQLFTYSPNIASYLFDLIKGITKLVDQISFLAIYADVDTYFILDKIIDSNFIKYEAPILNSICNGVTTNTSLTAFYSGLEELYKFKNELQKNITK